jgi:hypothetical protein
VESESHILQFFDYGEGDFHQRNTPEGKLVVDHGDSVSTYKTQNTREQGLSPERGSERASVYASP